MNKPSPNSFAEKISPEQHQQLINWLTDHSYAEVRELIAASAPEGFGIEVSIPTLSRFYKNHYNEISATRSRKLESRVTYLYEMHDPEGYRALLTDMATLCLQERLCHLLSQPIDSIDDLKKLTLICRQIRESKLDQFPDSDPKDADRSSDKKLKEVLAMLERAHTRSAQPQPL